MIYRLAWNLGCTIPELLERIDSEELTEWLAYMAIEPDAASRIDFQTMVLSHRLDTLTKCWSEGYNPQPLEIDWGKGLLDEDEDSDNEAFAKALQLRLNT